MIDCKTGSRIVVKIDDKYGPYIVVTTFQDAGALEDIFDDHLFITYWSDTPDECKENAGHWYYFGGIADSFKLQSILDNLEFNTLKNKPPTP